MKTHKKGSTTSTGTSKIPVDATASPWFDEEALRGARTMTSTGTSKITLDATAGPWFDEEALPGARMMKVDGRWFNKEAAWGEER
jgi:hypothetical protein